MNFLAGKKTYLCAIAVAVVTAAHYLGYLGGEDAAALLGVLGAGGLAALRKGVADK